MSIEVQNLTKTYGKQKALDSVSFSIERGEIVGFLGPNGAGKSTMMKILTGFLPLDSGIAKVNGKEVGKEKKAVQKQVGYLPEHNPLYTEMYVREYLAFNARVYRAPKERIEKVIRLTGLSKESNKKIEALSKGYRQRVGIANALLHDPEVLILDEPTTGLDPNQLAEIRELIKNTGSDKTVFLSTHIMQEVEAICDRAIIINNGRVVADKKLSELRKENKQCIVVEFDYLVEPQFLERIPELISSKNIGGFVYELYFDSTKDMRSEVFDFASGNGLKIIELNRKNQKLEHIFRELTRSENENPIEKNKL